jgi:hypothetical protein
MQHGRPTTYPASAAPATWKERPGPSARDATAHPEHAPTTSARTRCRTISAAKGTTAAAQNSPDVGRKKPTTIRSTDTSARTAASTSSRVSSRRERGGGLNMSDHDDNGSGKA